MKQPRIAPDQDRLPWSYAQIGVERSTLLRKQADEIDSLPLSIEVVCRFEAAGKQNLAD